MTTGPELMHDAVEKGSIEHPHFSKNQEKWAPNDQFSAGFSM
jgi:hypothetical protein